MTYVAMISALIWPILELVVVLHSPSVDSRSASGTDVAPLLSVAVASDRGSMAECMTVSHTSSMFGITRIFCGIVYIGISTDRSIMAQALCTRNKTNLNVSYSLQCITILYAKCFKKSSVTKLDPY